MSKRTENQTAKLFVVKFILIPMMIMVILAWMIWLLYSSLTGLPAESLAAWLLGVILMGLVLIVAGFFMGFWLGKTEQRGFLSGVDKALDKLADAVDFRDNARTNLSGRRNENQQAQPGMTVVLPNITGIPQITHRTADPDDVIDM